MDTYDDDGGWSNDDGLVTYTLSLTFRYASTSWSTYRSTFLGTGAYFEWKYRFYCDSYYYSNLCSIYCKARDDSSGHYTCGSSGTKNCSSGWGGTDCKYGKIQGFSDNETQYFPLRKHVVSKHIVS